mgnify:CR=1 FL=1
MGSREVEGAAGKIIVDAIKAKGGVQHVVYSSVACADVAPDAVGHFKSKLDVEEVSKLAVGSSAKMNFGLDANALATATLCCCPPDNSEGLLFLISYKPT